MIYLATFILLILASALFALGWRAFQNHLEISRLRKNGHRKLSFRPPSNRGSVDHEFLRGITEMLFVILLLASVLGWLAHSSPQ